MIHLTAASLVKVSLLPRLLGQVNHDDTSSLEIDHCWHSRALQRKINESTLDRVRGEHTLFMNFSLLFFVGYLYLCNNSTVKCVPCTVPHFIVHKDTNMISPKTSNMNCLSVCYTF